MIKNLYLVVAKRLAIKAFQAVDLGSNIVAQDAPIKCRTFGVPAKTLCVVQIFGEMRSINQQLFGHTAANDAGAANTMLLRHGNTRAMRCSNARSTDAAGACANDEEIIVKISHILFFPVSTRYGDRFIILPTGILAHCYRIITDGSDIAQRRCDQRSGRRVKTACTIVANAYGNLLAKLNAELVEGVNAQ